MACPSRLGSCAAQLDPRLPTSSTTVPTGPDRADKVNEAVCAAAGVDATTSCAAVPASAARQPTTSTRPHVTIRLIDLHLRLVAGATRRSGPILLQPPAKHLRQPHQKRIGSLLFQPHSARASNAHRRSAGPNHCGHVVR